jgi:hypothetical protein
MTGGVGGTDDGEFGDACRAEDADAQGVHLISSSRRMVARSPGVVTPVDVTGCGAAPL